MQKLSSLFVVTAKTEVRGEDEHFHFTNAQVFHNIRFDKFLEELEKGTVIGEYHETDPPFIMEADPGFIIEIDPPLIM